jgi:hypothetical protein
VTLIAKTTVAGLAKVRAASVRVRATRLLPSYPGATRRAPGNELCAVVAIAQGVDHALQDPERA